MERCLNFLVFLFRRDANGRKCIVNKNLIYLFYLLNLLTCSALLNNVVQKGIRFSSYCPNMEHCASGAHVMCMYYNPSATMGPNCGEGQNIIFTPELVELMLSIVNEIRASVARGEETGKDGVLLPRAYGMIRLKWDQELATFAQIWANQCTIQHDLCRATKRFPNPAQLVSLVRFTYPDWKLINDNSSQISEKGLTPSKLRHTITTTMRISYIQKERVTREMIESFPDLTKFPQLASIRVFMTMIHSESTHMGCGISAYADYYGKGSTSIIVNNVQVVCNFSAQPKPGSRVFPTQRAPGTSAKCGCPSDTLEDEDCLCVPRRYRDPNEEMRSCSKYDRNCGSPGNLPILNDVPPITLYHPLLSNESFFRRSSMRSNYHRNNIFDNQRRAQQSKGRFFKSNKKSDTRFGWSDDIVRVAGVRWKREAQDGSVCETWGRPMFSSERLLAEMMNNTPIPMSSHKNRVDDVRNRYFDKQYPVPGYSYRPGSSIPRDKHVPPNRKLPSFRRNSIFTRVSNFKLPLQNHHEDQGVFQKKNITTKRTVLKKDVKPRRDFSNLQNIVTAYLHKKNFNHTTSHSVNHLITAINTNTSKFGIAGFNTKISTKRFEIKNSEETDNKLLTLLDNLEEEVKHVELNDDIKDIFGERIRKIYGKVIGDHSRLDTDTKAVDDLIKHIQNNTENTRKLKHVQSNTENIRKPVQAHVDMPEIEFAVPQRRQYAMSLYDNAIPEQYRNKQEIFDKTDRHTYNNIIQYNSNVKRRGYKQDDLKKNDNFLSDDDLLGPERRRYYQNKLDNMERKLKSIRGYKRNDPKQDKGPFFRRVISSRQNGMHQEKTSGANNDMKNFYVPDRAKFLHGF